MAAGDAFSRDQRLRLDKALATAAAHTGLHFSAYVGPVSDDARRFANEMLARLVYDEAGAVLVVTSPGQRRVEVVTAGVARRRLSDQSCALAVMSMTTSFGVGDLVGGLVTGIRMLGETSALPPADHPRGAAAAH